jgi:hypothetical protein
MTNPIRTYDELLREKQRLTELLQSQKLIVKEDIAEIKEELAPVKSAIAMVGKFATRDNSNWLLTTAADKLIDVLLRKMILAKAGWFTKLAVPFVMKNFSSHVISDHKDQILGKLFSWFNKKEKPTNGKVPHDHEEEVEDED